MQRSWNYLYYATWKTLILLGEVLIEKPLVYFFNSVPGLKRNWNKGKKHYYVFMHSKESGANIGFAYSAMFLSTTIIYSGICLILVDVFNLEVGDTLNYYFTAVVVMSYVTNYLFLHRADSYKKYFKEFDKVTYKTGIYASGLLFHLGVLVFGILSVHFSIGFDF